jgi:hypothetical protein
MVFGSSGCGGSPVLSGDSRLRTRELLRAAAPMLLGIQQSRVHSHTASLLHDPHVWHGAERARDAV